MSRPLTAIHFMANLCRLQCPGYSLDWYFDEHVLACIQWCTHRCIHIARVYNMLTVCSFVYNGLHTGVPRTMLYNLVHVLSLVYNVYTYVYSLAQLWPTIC